MAMLQRRPHSIPEVSEEMLLLTANANPEKMAMLRSFGMGAMLSVPLIKCEQIFGAMTLVSHRPHRYQPDDIRQAEDLALLCALAIDQARLFQQAEAANQRALRSSEARLAGVIASAMDGILCYDDEGIIRIFNRASERIFGCVAGAAIGTDVERFLPARYRSEPV